MNKPRVYIICITLWAGKGSDNWSNIIAKRLKNIGQMEGEMGFSWRIFKVRIDFRGGKFCE